MKTFYFDGKTYLLKRIRKVYYWSDTTKGPSAPWYNAGDSLRKKTVHPAFKTALRSAFYKVSVA